MQANFIFLIKKSYLFFIYSLWFLVCSFLKEKKPAGIDGVRKAQERKLLKIIRLNESTLFGRERCFSSITNYRDFCENVPVSTYDNYEIFIKKIMKGNRGVLCQDKILFLVPSSGSTSASKLIPFTKRLKHEYAGGIRSWLYYLFRRHKKLWTGKCYWSVSPIAIDHPSLSQESSCPISIADDSAYFSPLETFFIKLTLAVPLAVSQINDITTFRYVTLLFLLRCSDLRMVSVWNPMFFVTLLSFLQKNIDDLICDIKNGGISHCNGIENGLHKYLLKKLSTSPERAFKLSQIWSVESSGFSQKVQETWPGLCVVSCWADAYARYSAMELHRMLPFVHMQPKGLLATEGLVSYPAEEDDAMRIAVSAHFFEFVEVSNNSRKASPRRLHELDVGKEYEVLLTTSGGLYRYNLQDVVRVVKIDSGVPYIRFVGKNDQVSDLCGEKINSRHVGSVLDEFFHHFDLQPSIAFLAPEKQGERFGYTLFVSGVKKPGDIYLMQNWLERKLCENFHYHYCRSLGQLSHSTVYPIHCENPLAVFLDQYVSLGKVLGDVKPPVLDKNIWWREVFEKAA